MSISPPNTPTDKTLLVAGDEELEDSSLGNPYYIHSESTAPPVLKTSNPQGPIPDFYSILEVAPTASQPEISAAYKVLASANHPSRHPQCSKKFNQICHAYSVLSEPSRRYYYDELTQFKPSKTDALRNFQAFFRDFELEPEEKQFFDKHYPSKQPTLYQVLGVKKNATPLEIEDAFRERGLELHPRNRGGDEQAEKVFTLLCRAYSILSDKERRACYDQTLNNHEIPSEIAFNQFNEKFKADKFQKAEDDHKLGDLVKKASFKRQMENARQGLPIPQKMIHPVLESDHPEIVVPKSMLPKTPTHIAETNKGTDNQKPKESQPDVEKASTATNKDKGRQQKPSEPTLHHDTHRPLQHRYRPEGWPAYSYEFNHSDDKYNYHNYEQDILHETVTHKTPNGPVTKKTQTKTSQLNGRQVKQKVESVVHPDGRQDITHTVTDHRGETTNKWSVKDGKQIQQLPASRQ